MTATASAILAESRLTDEVVYDYWQKKAEEDGVSPSLTIRDLHYREVEIDAIRRYLRPSDRVLDAGCGNGYSTLKFAGIVREITGVDYSPKMVEVAGQILERTDAPVAARTRFQFADARELPFPSGLFSRVISERCLINIPDRSQQCAAAHEFARVLSPGGLLLLAEVTLQGHERVNHYRSRFGLDKLKVHWHNTYIDEPVFLDSVNDVFDLVETVRFGMYGFLSKVVHAMMVAPDEPCFDARINEVAARIAREIPDFDGCSHQVLFVLRKR